MLLFYYYINANNPARQKLFFDEEFEPFAVDFTTSYFSLDYFSGLCEREDYKEIVPSFIANAALGIIRRWKKKPIDNRVSLDRLADGTAKLLMTGLNGLNQ